MSVDNIKSLGDLTAVSAAVMCSIDQTKSFITLAIHVFLPDE